MPRNETVQSELAKLYVKLHHHEKAIKLLTMTYCNPNEETLGNILRLVLLSEVYEASGQRDMFKTTLIEAKRLSTRLLRQARPIDSEQNNDKKRVTSAICTSLAKCAEVDGDICSAGELYKEAMHFIPGDEDTMNSLAELYLQNNRLSE
eukprot:12681798-Ditylum_brightwellii.AAC.1